MCPPPFECREDIIDECVREASSTDRCSADDCGAVLTEWSSAENDQILGSRIHLMIVKGLVQGCDQNEVMEVQMAVQQFF